MSQKLTELLESISPLPWDSGGPCRTTERERAANLMYRVHAANVLPELVIAASEFLASILTIGGANNKKIKRLQDALASAEEVKDHSEHWDFNDQETFQP